MFGFTYGYGFKVSTALAQALIDYRMDSFNVTDDGDRTVDNVGSGGSTYDGNAYSSNMIALQSTQSLDVDIAHTFGSEEFVTNGTFDTDISGWAMGSGTTATVVSGEVKITAGSQYGIYQELSGLIIGKTYTVSGIGRIDSTGDVRLRYYPDTFNVGTYIDSNTITSTSNGIMSITFVAESTSPVIYLRCSATGIVGYFDNISVKQITNPNSFLTYYNGITKDVEVIGNSVDGGSSEELLPNVVLDDTSDWTTSNAIISVASNELIVEDDGTFSFADSAFTVEANKTYLVSFDVRNPNNTGGYIWGLSENTNNAVPNIYYSSTDTALTSKTITYLYSSILSGLRYIRLGQYGQGTGDISYFSNITIKEILPISTTYTFTEGQTIQNVLPTTVQPTAQDIANLRAYPEDFYKLATGKTTKGTYSFDSGSVYAYYPCNDYESGQYVQDLSVALGDELVINGAFDTDVSGWNNSGLAVMEWVSGEMHMVGDNADRSDQTVTVESGEYYIINIDTRLISGGLGLYLRSESYYDYEANLDISNGYSKIIYTLDTSLRIWLRFNLDSSEAYMDNISVKKITAKEIANYTTSARLQNQNYGMSNLPFKQDATGRITGLSDSGTIEFTGDGRYVDTGWIPSANEDWTLEFEFKMNEDFTEIIYPLRLSNLYTYSFRVISNTRAYYYDSKGRWYLNNVCDFRDINKIVIVNRETDTLFYVNGVLTNASLYSGTYSSEGSMLLGNNSKTTMSKFKVHNKLLTDEEIQAL